MRGLLRNLLEIPVVGQFELPILDSTLAAQIGACHIKDMARPKRPRDTNQLAKLIVDAATGEHRESLATEPVNGFVKLTGFTPKSR